MRLLVMLLSLYISSPLSISANSLREGPSHLENTTELENPTPSNTEKYQYVKQYDCEYNWTIEYFKLHQEDVNLQSPTFSPDDTNYEWFLKLHADGKEHSFALNLWLESGKSAYEKFGSVAGELEIALIDSNGQKSHIRRERFKTTKLDQSVYIDELVKQPDLINPANGLLPEGELRIHCRVSFNLVNEIDYVLRDEYKKYFENDGDVGLWLEIPDSESKLFPVHKFILEQRSPVFKEFLADMEGSEIDKIYLSDIDLEKHSFKEMLRYVYTGKVKNLRTHVFKLTLAAHDFEIERLIKMCEGEIVDMLSNETAVQILLLSEMHHLKVLQEKTIEYIEKYVEKMDLVKGLLEATRI